MSQSDCSQIRAQRAFAALTQVMNKHNGGTSMKKTSVTLAGILAVSFALPAMAGPNWTVIQEAVKNHQAAKQKQASHKDSIAQQEVLPMDHGPRALSTPWLNQKREQYLLAQAHKKKTSFLAYHSLGSKSFHG
jgi:hypothetical protein